MTDETQARCSAMRGDQPCPNYGLEGTDPPLCLWHGGPQQKKAKRKENGDVGTPDVGTPPEGKSSENVRRHLKRSADVHASEIEEALLATLKATKTLRVVCPSCRHRIEKEYPDATGRANAARTLVELGHGRAKEESVKEIDPATIDPLDVPSMSAEERAAFKRALYLTDPERLAAARRFREELRDPAYRERLRAELADVEAFLPLLRRLPRKQHEKLDLYGLRCDLARFAEGMDGLDGEATRLLDRKPEGVRRGD